MSRPRVTTGQQRTALSLKAQGFSTMEAARQLSVNGSLVEVTFNAGRFTSGVADSWSPRAGHLSVGEREEPGGSVTTPVAPVDRSATRTPPLDRVPRGAGQRRTGELPELEGARSRSREGAPPQGVHTATRPPRTQRPSPPGRAVVTARDLRTLSARRSEPRGDAGESRDDRSVARRKGPGRTEARTGPLCAHGSHPTPESGSPTPPREDPRPGDDLRATARGRRSGRSRTLGDLVVGLGHRSAMGTLVERVARRPLAPLAPRTHRRDRRGGYAQGHREPAHRATPERGVGSRSRDDQRGQHHHDHGHAPLPL